MEAFRDLSEIASHMVNDGYTEGLITEFSRRQRWSASGGDAILRTWFSDLGVDWVLGVDQNLLQEQPWSAVEDMIKRWVVAFTVMAEALRLTRPGFGSDDGSGGGVAPLSSEDKYRVQRSAPAGVALTSSMLPAESSPGSSDLNQESSDPARHKGFDVATVKEAIIAYSAAEKGRFFRFGQQEPEPEYQFVLFAEASLMKMMRFPDAVAALKRSPEKILRMIDMYSLVSDASPGLLALLSGESKNHVSRRIGSVLDTMSEAVREILQNLMSLIQAEDSWRTVQGNDDIHPVNQYVMNYINLLLENCTVLDLMLPWEDIVFADDSSLTSTIDELVNCLDAMLEEKSKVYAAAGRRYIFLLNNAYFILQQAEPALEGFLGTWSAYRKQQINRYIKGYLDASWGPVISGLAATKQRRNSLFRKVSALVEFSALLQTTYHTDKSCKINSPQLRSTLRKSVSRKVISAYRAYLVTHGLVETSATYTPEDLENLFQDLFEG
uniref:Exocyst subunit Exo70 family protein n=1 Tax=Arundo donax TaxID=35708 RepID=A0A0A9A761_ARUDO